MVLGVSARVACTSTFSINNPFFARDQLLAAFLGCVSTFLGCSSELQRFRLPSQGVLPRFSVADAAADAAMDGFT